MSADTVELVTIVPPFTLDIKTLVEVDAVTTEIERLYIEIVPYLRRAYDVNRSVTSAVSAWLPDADILVEMTDAVPRFRALMEIVCHLDTMQGCVLPECTGPNELLTDAEARVEKMTAASGGAAFVP